MADAQRNDDEPADSDQPQSGQDAQVDKDATEPVPPVPPVSPGGPDSTSVMPPADEVWTGRAEVPPAGPTQPVPVGERRRRTWWTPWLLALLALLLLGLVVLGGWLALRDDEPTVVPSVKPTPPAPTTQAPTSSPPSPAVTSPAPQMVTVPADLVGLTQDEAMSALDGLGLAYQLNYRESSEPAGKVIDSNPAPGTQVAEGTKVALTIAIPIPEPSPSPSPSPSSSPSPSPSPTP